jgi:glucosamine--fructose-6-phosphate aminotransferase (isomerizing)
MCGIIGYIGEQSNNNLLNGLKQLQNRGYDSAGICKIENDSFIVHKYASDVTTNAIVKLEYNIMNDELLNNENHENNMKIGIAHTRWATHGPKTDNNSHPHVSMDNKFAIVHNGIIENYKILKDLLMYIGYEFKSSTDSEVIANLLSYEYTKNNDILTAIKNTIHQLEGTWGIAILCIDYPNCIYCTRHGSPLLVSSNENFAMVVSEQNGFCGKVENYYVLKNMDLCILNYDGKINLLTEELYISKPITTKMDDLDPFPYSHWTIKEIFEQDESSLRAISLGGRINRNERVKLGGLDQNKKILKKITNLILLGCGTSHYAGMLGIHYLKDLCNFDCVVNIDAAEFTENDIPTKGNTAFILLSQSGETKDLYNCIEIGKKNNIFLIGVINVVDSMIAREVNCGCYLNAGREVSVASTKSFTSQVIILSMISIWFAQLHNINLEKRKLYINDLRQLNNDIKITLNTCQENVKKILPFFQNYSSCFVLGKGKALSIAKEGSLKIKELSRIHAEGYSISSLKHGPFALLDDGFPVIMIAPNNSDFVKFENAYEEITSRHAIVIFITNKNNCKYNNVIYVPNNNTYSELLSVLPLQFLSYYLSIEKGLNPDMPKNLAKVVTVE